MTAFASSGARLVRAARAGAGLSQRQLGQAAGVAPSTVARVETTGEGSIALLERLLGACDSRLALWPGLDHDQRADEEAEKLVRAHPLDRLADVVEAQPTLRLVARHVEDAAAHVLPVVLHPGLSLLLWLPPRLAPRDPPPVAFTLLPKPPRSYRGDEVLWWGGSLTARRVLPLVDLPTCLDASALRRALPVDPGWTGGARLLHPCDLALCLGWRPWLARLCHALETAAPLDAAHRREPAHREVDHGRRSERAMWPERLAVNPEGYVTPPGVLRRLS